MSAQEPGWKILKRIIGDKLFDEVFSVFMGQRINFPKTLNDPERDERIRKEFEEKNEPGREMVTLDGIARREGISLVRVWQITHYKKEN